MLETLFKNLNKNTIVIVPNRRLGIFLKKEYNLYQESLGQKTWVNKKIVQLDYWLKEIWKNCTSYKILLNDHQERAIWEDIISNFLSGSSSLSVESTAQLANNAWKLLKQWNINFGWISYSASEDELTFQKWANKFCNICETNNWIDISSIANKMIEYLDNKIIKPANHLILVGFEDLPPLYKLLVDTIKKHGGKVEYFDPNNKISDQKRITFVSQEQEITDMALWVKKWATKAPESNIGCIAPNLTTIRPQIDYIFNQILGCSFDISAGRALNTFPILNSALKILNLSDNKLPINHIDSILNSPFIGGANQEHIARSLLSAKLHKEGAIYIPMRQILSLAKHTEHLYHCPILAKNLECYLQIAKKNHQLQAPSYWVKHIVEQLQILGWPGDRALNDDEIQLFKRWQKLLAEFATLDLIIAKMSSREALDKLSSMADAVIYQPKYEDKRIKVLGTLEAAGLNFDYLWIMGLTDTQWPQPPNPNPFIPLHLQKKFNMPHASPERELEFSYRLLERFSKSAQTIIYSHPQQDNQKEFRGSFLIQDIPTITSKELELPKFSWFAINNSNSPLVEAFSDDKAPPVIKANKFEGGSEILKSQSACPFSAFAKCRLNARDVDHQPQLGLNPAERGTIIHTALEILWNKIQNSEKLSLLSDQQQETFINESVEYALLKQKKNTPFKMTARFSEIEKNRLTALLRNWLKFEKQKRAVPFTVLTKEKYRSVQIGELNIDIKVDRIDQMQDGSHLILDYKTGATNTANWDGERPNDPQLPLYCITSQIPIHGIAFAETKNGKLKFKGISEKNYEISGITEKNDWLKTVRQWREVLNNLSKEFIAGNAEVNPKNNPETCRYCKLQSLCRIKEIDYE